MCSQGLDFIPLSEAFNRRSYESKGKITKAWCREVEGRSQDCTGWAVRGAARLDGGFLEASTGGTHYEEGSVAS